MDLQPYKHLSTALIKTEGNSRALRPAAVVAGATAMGIVATGAIALQKIVRHVQRIRRTPERHQPATVTEWSARIVVIEERVRLRSGR